MRHDRGPERERAPAAGWEERDEEREGTRERSSEPRGRSSAAQRRPERRGAAASAAPTDAEVPLPAGSEPAGARAPDAGTARRASTDPMALVLERTADQLATLLHATEAISSAATLQEVLDVTLAQALGAFRALGAHIALLTDGGATLDVPHGAGSLAEPVATRSGISAEAPHPATEVARTGAPLFLESADGWRERFPTAPLPRGARPDGAWAILPLIAQHEVIGTFGMTFDGPRAFAPDDRELMRALARQCAQGISRARLYEASLEASRAKSEFLAVMSHELRTPLTAILGHEELLSEGIFGPLTTAQREHLARIHASGEHLLMLIDDVLRLTRVQAGHDPVRMEPCVVDDVVDEALRAIAPAVEAKGLELVHRRAPRPIQLHTDRTKLRHIITNIAANAAKFTDRGRIEVETRAGRGRAMVAVHDTGIGISAEHLLHVFDTFWQVDQRLTRASGGVGMGLAVARELARLLGGDVQARSRPGEGSTFTTWLPLRRAGHITRGGRAGG